MKETVLQQTIFKCDAEGCSKQTKPVPESTFRSLSIDKQIPPGWYRFQAYDGHVAQSLGGTLADGIHACSRACAAKMLDQSLDLVRIYDLRG